MLPPELGNEDGSIPIEQSAGKPTTRRYSDQENAASVRMVQSLGAEEGTKHGPAHRAATQFNKGVPDIHPIRTTPISP